MILTGESLKALSEVQNRDSGFAVFFTFVALFLATTLAMENKKLQNEEAILAELSDLLQSPQQPMDQSNQFQLRQEGTGNSNPGSCHCTCNCNSQPTWGDGLGPVCPNYYPNCYGSLSGRPRDCQELYQRGNARTGVYAIYPDGLPQGIYVRCDMDTAGGGWTVIQRRVSGNVDFFRNLSDYKQGFGDLNGNFWLGNDNIHALTAQENYQLRIDLSVSDTNKTYATYSSFKVGDENSSYFLTAGGYSGTAGDSFSYHSGAKFSTKDQDNDIYGLNCAELYKGGWWYKACHQSNLNGIYGSVAYGQGINWFTFAGYYTSMVYADMKVRKL
ncbi:hypothetical protein CHS0354_008405 [Potamilus streckersoni]|uniref:Fibrinogen C-terminal domain-containing protein n=1 Tax=Potamilus streckersoni TaxID=2493646 RepID=A0AAE0RPN8_9BIVA|nr:hypothetical protein CHS0354_008405 [Potamilus streckersoni]